MRRRTSMVFALALLMVLTALPATAHGRHRGDTADHKFRELAQVKRATAHTSNAPIALVTPDGVVATGGFDGFYRHWDLTTGDLLFELQVEGVRGHTIPAFSPDYEYFYYEDRDGIVRRMPADVDRMVEEALASVTRDLTDDECQRYLKLASCAER